MIPDVNSVSTVTEEGIYILIDYDRYYKVTDDTSDEAWDGAMGACGILSRYACSFVNTMHLNAFTDLFAVGAIVTKSTRIY